MEDLMKRVVRNGQKLYCANVDGADVVVPFTYHLTPDGFSMLTRILRVPLSDSINAAVKVSNMFRVMMSAWNAANIPEVTYLPAISTSSTTVIDESLPELTDEQLGLLLGMVAQCQKNAAVKLSNVINDANRNIIHDGHLEDFARTNARNQICIAHVAEYVCAYIYARRNPDLYTNYAHDEEIPRT